MGACQHAEQVRALIPGYASGIEVVPIGVAVVHIKQAVFRGAVTRGDSIAEARVWPVEPRRPRLAVCGTPMQLRAVWGNVGGNGGSVVGGVAQERDRAPGR